MQSDFIKRRHWPQPIRGIYSVHFGHLDTHHDQIQFERGCRAYGFVTVVGTVYIMASPVNISSSMARFTSLPTSPSVRP
jgi:hypothetical protein